MNDAILAQAAKTIRAAQPGVPIVQAFFHEPSCTASYVIHDPATKAAAIIDSVLDYDAASGRTATRSADMIRSYIHQQALSVQWLLETHAHADHLSSAPYLHSILGGKLAIGRNIIRIGRTLGALFNMAATDGIEFDRLFDDGDCFSIGELTATVLHVPGHTPADVAYVIGDAAFVGDTIFMPDYGTARADFPGGDARQLYRSIRRLLALPASTRIFVGHDYKAPGRDRYAWQTTVGAQRSDNIHVRDGVSEEDFALMREQRDATLSVPQLLLPAVQVNLRGGRLPQAETNGIRYLKIPLDAFGK
ncbi:MBL fold metallo-hydrolase [Peristeroidobacter soli]|uniref:MBL fold metallo-hydrolase n=1 Tax=Peristeroidobacter soli TaxID=2497877 RepID=UPI00101B9A71|nr:MBL fold metallo-hydrolase [Peristeroidobacter soli]